MTPDHEPSVEVFLEILSEWDAMADGAATVRFEDFGTSKSQEYEVARNADELRMLLRSLRAYMNWYGDSPSLHKHEEPEMADDVVTKLRDVEQRGVWMGSQPAEIVGRIAKEAADTIEALREKTGNSYR